MSELSDFQVGQTVELNDGRTALVHYIGSPHFAPGNWIGVVLDDATGKNDGSVQGQRYFDCQPGHGMFVRPGAATVIDQPTPRPKERPQLRANGVITKNKPQNVAAGGLKRQSLADAGAVKRQSINAGSPTPGANGPLRSRLGVRNSLLSPHMESMLRGIVAQQIAHKAAQLNRLIRQPITDHDAFKHAEAICPS